MKNALQKTFSLTEKHKDMLREMAYKSGMKESKIIQIMIEIVNGNDINLWMIKSASTTKNMDMSSLRIMSDGENRKKAPTQEHKEYRNDAKPGDTGFKHFHISEEELQRNIDIAKTQWID